MNKDIQDFCPTFYDWPMRWCGVEEDMDVGRRILACFEPFAAELVASNLAAKTKKRHLDNLWLLGGEIVYRVSVHDQYHEDIVAITRRSVDDEGGPPSKHLHTDEEIRSFDATCRKLARHFAQHQ